MAGNLYIKWNSGDTGGRPIPAGSTWWLSPSIWINSPGNAQASSGQPNLIYVQPDFVGGGSGTDSTDVTVRAWVCNPTSAPGPSGATIPSAGGAGGSKGVILAGMTGVSFPLMSGLLVNDWVPTTADVAVNGGHLCIVANVFDKSGGADSVDVTTGVMDVVNNQHQAQHNISLVMGLQQMSLQVPFWFPVLEALPEADRGRGLIRVQPVGGVLEQVTKEELLRDPRVTLEHEESTEPRQVFNPYCLQEPPERTRLRKGGELILSGSAYKIHRSEAAPERAGILFEDRVQPEIEVTPVSGAAAVRTFVCELSKDDFGGVHEFDIVHTTADGRVVGGMRVVVLNARPCY